MTALTLNTNSNCSFIENGLREIFGSEFTKVHIGRDGLQSALLSMKSASSQQLGSDEAGGLYLRAGRAGFTYWMRQYSADLGWKEIDYRLLPAPVRIKRSIIDLLGWMEAEKFLKADLSDLSDTWQISATGLTGSNARLDCSYFTGMLQELCSWAGGGKFYQVRESQCQADGTASCVFVIDKKPAD
jgi:hypothetical protein